jgi:hypothetical protein
VEKKIPPEMLMEISDSFPLEDGCSWSFCQSLCTSIQSHLPYWLSPGELNMSIVSYIIAANAT